MGLTGYNLVAQATCESKSMYIKPNMVNFTVALLIALITTGASGQAIFVTDYNQGTIGEYTTSGIPINASLVQGLTQPAGLAVSGSDIFVANYHFGTIGEYTTSGETINKSLISGLTDPAAIVVVGSNLYILSGYTGAVAEYTTSGELENPALVSGAPNSKDQEGCGITASGDNLFVCGGNSVFEITVAGSTVGGFLSGAGSVQYLTGISVEGANVFVTGLNPDAIGKYTISGATVNSQLADVDFPNGIAAFGPDLFVTQSYPAGVCEYTTGGTTVNSSLIHGFSDPWGIVVVADVPEPNITLLGVAMLPILLGRKSRRQAI